MADADLGNEAGAAPGDEGMPVVYDDRPSPNAPIEERQAWILEHRGPGVFSDEVLEEMRERYCALPGCTSTAKRGSLFCPYHHGTALGEAGARELRQLNREMERLARTTDRDDRKLAIAKFNARVERGDATPHLLPHMEKGRTCSTRTESGTSISGQDGRRPGWGIPTGG